jgi:predicted transcriptional regulator
MEKMNLKQVAEDLGFVALSGKEHLGRTPESAYVSDLLSDVMGNAKEGMIWVTSQIHKNIIAVASLNDLSAILIINGRPVSDELVELAEKEDVVILSTKLAAFDAVGLLYDYLTD